MSPTPSDNDLTRTLTREAERFAGTSGGGVSVDGVLERAGEIRRGRRLRATLAMAAVVLAIAVPVGIKVAGDPAAAPKPPAPAAPTNRSAISLDGLATGKPPALGYTEGTTLHLPDGSYDLRGNGRPAYLAQFDGGVLVSSTADDQGNLQAELLPADSTATPTSWPLQGGFAVSSDGNVAAFVEPDGSVVTIEDSNARITRLPRITGAGSLEVAAVDGHSCDGATGKADCTVYVNQRDETPQVWAVTPDGSPELFRTGLVSVDDLGADGRFAGLVSTDDSGSCSAVQARSKDLWDTCDHRFTGGFSPDAKHLLAAGPYGDGVGDGALAVLDARTGKVLLDLDTTLAAAITQTVWEDDDHVLAVVVENGSSAVLRIDLRGERELALPKVATPEEFISSYLLDQG